MELHIEYLLYIYIIITLSMIVFDLFTVSNDNLKSKRIKRKSLKFQDEILSIISLDKKDEEHIKLLIKKLKKIENLMAYHNAIVVLLDNVKYESSVRKYLKEYKLIFNSLAQIYSKKPDMYKAYFAYIMSIYKINSSNDSNYITDILLEFSKNESLYVRENTLKALISFGNELNVFKALRNIARREYAYNNKLLCDDLLEFSGSHEELARILFDNIKIFNVEMTLGIINYINYVSDNFKKELYEMLQDKNVDKEIHLAIIRYFGKHEYKQALDYMYNSIKDESSNNWEYSNACVTSLKLYPSKKTKEVLKKSLQSSNWYVRKNAAKSLLHLSLLENEEEIKLDTDDVYAIEMMKYEIEKKENFRRGR